ncbi:hypothetical protein P691DRAFT_707098 [Macrolepiota fuliginosa MF-IS2]|uniref:DUF3533 domain-containing protein n=1 Tax=Macrolepiota fuliginosa MF-IS2 TaxID=1400762 RepID=A0A9P5XAT7_9AGAR|nr:hypothetical protein P691DRAFT_707098 [Macrolepiota fuliginosa MF-IS2]
MALDDSSYDDVSQSRTTLDGQKVPVGPSSHKTLPSGARLYENRFFSSDATITEARKQYLKVIVGGVVITSIFIFAIFSILWGAFYRTPARNLPGWIVDFDDGVIGQSVVAGLTAPNSASKITWTVVSAEQFPGGVDDVSHAVLEEKAWIAVTINSGSSDGLKAALTTPNAAYDGTQAISVFGVEARNENAFRTMLRPSAEGALTAISARFASQLAQSLSNSQVISQLLATSPQTVTSPISYQFVNLRPFNQTLASVVTFTGLIFVVILSFFVVVCLIRYSPFLVDLTFFEMIGNGARESTNLHRLLTFRSLLALRLTTTFVAYFFLSLFYSLLSLAFQFNVSLKFGHSGFLVFWMLNLCAMCALGLAIESMLTLLTPKFIPFFLLTWIIANVATCAFPIEALPILYRYGYASPFYNMSKAARTIVFGTRNRVGFHFGILLIWAVISCITLALFQFLARRHDAAATKKELTGEKESLEG